MCHIARSSLKTMGAACGCDAKAGNSDLGGMTSVTPGPMPAMRSLDPADEQVKSFSAALQSGD